METLHKVIVLATNQVHLRLQDQVESEKMKESNMNKSEHLTKKLTQVPDAVVDD